MKMHNFYELTNEINVVQKFPSRRHSVYKVELTYGVIKMPAVLKVYSGEQAKNLCRTEYENLLKLFDLKLPVPKVLAKGEKSLLLEYLRGLSVSHIAENLNTGRWIEGMAYWFSKLHSIKLDSGCLLKGDANLRNFIFSNGKIYGLDFEEMECGDFRQDLAEVSFFLLNDTPSLVPEKDLMVRRFLKAYKEYTQKPLENITKFILKSKTRARMRRRHYCK